MDNIHFKRPQINPINQTIACYNRQSHTNKLFTIPYSSIKYEVSICEAIFPYILHCSRLVRTKKIYSFCEFLIENVHQSYNGNNANKNPLKFHSIGFFQKLFVCIDRQLCKAFKYFHEFFYVFINFYGFFLELVVNLRTMDRILYTFMHINGIVIS